MPVVQAPSSGWETDGYYSPGRSGVSYAPGYGPSRETDVYFLPSRTGPSYAPGYGPGQTTETTDTQSTVPSLEEIIESLNETYSGAYAVADETPTYDVTQEAWSTMPQISYKPQSYYDTATMSAKEALRNEFFGKGGKWEQGMSAESAAGRLDSPVARRMLSQTVTDPFVQQAAQIDRDMLMAQLDEQYKADAFNQEMQRFRNEALQSAMQADAQNATQIRTTLDNLIGTVALGYSGQLTQQETEYALAALEEYTAGLDRAAEMATTTLNAVDLARDLVEDAYERGVSHEDVSQMVEWYADAYPEGQQAFDDIVEIVYGLPPTTASGGMPENA